VFPLYNVVFGELSSQLRWHHIIDRAADASFNDDGVDATEQRRWLAT
jgi:hypothetical protein